MELVSGSQDFVVMWISWSPQVPEDAVLRIDDRVLPLDCRLGAVRAIERGAHRLVLSVPSLGLRTGREEDLRTDVRIALSVMGRRSPVLSLDIQEKRRRSPYAY